MAKEKEEKETKKEEKPPVEAAKTKSEDAPKHQDFPVEAGPKFKMGQVVFHPAALDGSFPQGKGSIVDIKETANGPRYTIKCDKINHILMQKFREEELKPAF